MRGMLAAERGLAAMLSICLLAICLLAGCAFQARPHAAAEVRCQLGRQSVPMTEARCLALGGMVLP